MVKKLWKKLVNFFKFVLKDKASKIIFVIVFLVMSSEVWLCYLLGFIFQNAWLLGIASACWLFWLGPFTPFLPICLAITAGIRALWGKLRKKGEHK